MNIKEKDYCFKLLLEGLSYARQSQSDFKKASNTNLSDYDRKIAELQGHNHGGYAQGIYQSLVVLKYEHEQMKELEKLI